MRSIKLLIVIGLYINLISTSLSQTATTISSVIASTAAAAGYSLNANDLATTSAAAASVIAGGALNSTVISSALVGLSGTSIGNMTGLDMGNITGMVSGILGGMSGTNGTVDPFSFSSNDFLQMMKTMNDAIPLIEASNDNLNLDSTSFSMKLSTALSKLIGEFGLYYTNNCTDSRVPQIFNSQPGSEDYSSQCQLLTYDWTQTYGPYVCNDWFCNLQGTCSSKADADGFIFPTCVCKTGYYGQNCMFNTTTFKNADQWINLSKTWLDNYLKANKGIITDGKVLSDVLDYAQNILMVTSNVNTQDMQKYSDIISFFGNAIIKSNVTMTNDVEAKLYSFMDFISTNIDSSINGMDPSAIVGMTNDTLKLTDNFELQKKNVDPEKELLISPKDGTKLRFLNSVIIRILAAAAGKKPAKKNINTDSAKLTIPQTVTSKLANNEITFVSTKDPSSMSQINSVTINSQIVSIKATDKTTKVLTPFPANTGSMQIYLPWAYVPFTVTNNNYSTNCKVYSFDGKTWNLINSCSVQTTSTTTAAQVSCSAFGTFGVACNGATVTPATSTLKTSGFSLKSLYSLIIYALLGILLF